MFGRLKPARSYLITQLQQTSTWRGLTLVLTASGVMKRPEWGEAIITAGLMVAGLIGVLFADDVKVTPK